MKTFEFSAFRGIYLFLSISIFCALVYFYILPVALGFAFIATILLFIFAYKKDIDYTIVEQTGSIVKDSYFFVKATWESRLFYFSFFEYVKEGSSERKRVFKSKEEAQEYIDCQKQCYIIKEY